MSVPTNPIPPPEPPEPDNSGASDDQHEEQSRTTDRDVEYATLRSEAAKWRKQLREVQAENERLKLAGASEAEKAVAAARAEGASEYQRRWRKTLVENAALAVLAERGCSATEPALRSLDLDDIDVDEGGKFDRAQVSSRVDDLLHRYPIFAPPGGAPPLPSVTGDGQRRLTADSQVRPSGKLTDAQTEELLRYGLGGRS